MPRLNIEHTCVPKNPRNDLEEIFPGFETYRESCDEEKTRIDILHRAEKTEKGSKRRAQLKAVIKCLEHNLFDSKKYGPVTKSPASAIGNRAHRRAALGCLLKLARKAKPGKLVFFTAIPRGKKWLVSAHELKNVDPTALLAALRVALHRCGSAKASGWMYAVVEAEFDPGSGLYQLHVHGLASCEMIEVLERLDKCRTYESDKVVWNRLDIDYDLADLPRVTSYVHKSFWCSRTIWFDDDGKRHRQKRRRRIPAEHYADHIIWLAKHRMKDLTLLIHLRVTKNRRLKYTRG